MVKKPVNQRHVGALQFIRYYYRAMVSPRFREISEELSQAEADKAATLASKWQWHDSAIRTVAKTPHRSDYSRASSVKDSRYCIGHWGH